MPGLIAERPGTFSHSALLPEQYPLINQKLAEVHGSLGDGRHLIPPA